MKQGFRIGLGALCLLGLTGCMSEDLRSTYANDFSCASDDIDVEKLGLGRYRVTGCGRTVSYTCGGVCSPDHSPDDEPARETARAASSPKAAPAPDGMGSAHVEKSKAGGSLVALELRLDKATLLKLQAAPDGNKPVELKVLSLSDDTLKPECDLSAMIDGQRVQLPKAQITQKQANDPEGRNLAVLQTELGPPLVRELAVARQFALRACDLHWSVSPEGLAELHHFAELYQEERAWQGPAVDGGTGGLMAPAEGWPAWKVSGTAPNAVTSGPALEAPALFKLLSPSVFRVVAVSTGNTMQGSAVAVSRSELLTNCHVLEGAQKITLQQGKLERKATIARANPAADRCVLAVSEASLTPIHGVRAYAELEVGEPMFTLGSPNGLELSLANGILSGKRDEDGRPFVQTTAPISPGSSGGGLFDARGNLVGITSMVLVGREHLNQSLNFAIPADTFWSAD
jgi:hypothetical protein